MEASLDLQGQRLCISPHPTAKVGLFRSLETDHGHQSMQWEGSLLVGGCGSSPCHRESYLFSHAVDLCWQAQLTADCAHLLLLHPRVRLVHPGTSTWMRVPPALRGQGCKADIP